MVNRGLITFIPAALAIALAAPVAGQGSVGGIGPQAHPWKATKAQFDTYTCSDGGAFEGVIVAVTDASDTTTCPPAGTGANTVTCQCVDGTWSAIGSGSGGSGDITAVGDCATGDCFQATTERHGLLGPVGGGQASFRALVEADISDIGSYLENIVEDTTPQLGGNLDVQGNDISAMGNVTFKTGSTGGTIRTGTSNADKYVLQAYDVDDAVYRTMLELDAGNTALMELLHVTNLTMDTTGTIRTGTSAGETLLFGAYDTSGANYTTFGTLTAGNPPTFDLSASTTVGGASIQTGTDDTGTDDQVATEVPYIPSTPGDWTDPDPAEVGGALDTLAARDVTADDLTDNSVTDLSDVTAVSGNTTTLATTSGTLTFGNCVEIDAAGNLVDAGAACGGGSSGFDAITGGTNTSAAMLVGTGSSLRISGSGVIGASEVDGDGDGTAEFDVDGSVLVARTGNFKVELNASDYIQFISGGTNADIRLGSGSGGLMNFLAESASAGIRFSPNGNTKALECDDGDCEVSYTLVLGPSTATCPDSGDGSAGFLVITPGTSTVRVTQSDAHGCTGTLSETGAKDGQQLRVSNVSNAGGTLDFADSSGVQETGSGCSLGDRGIADFEYQSDRWVLANCRTTN